MVQFFAELFRRCEQSEVNGIQIAKRLEEQHRMHPDIACLISRCFYKGRLKTHPDATARFMSETPPFVPVRTAAASGARVTLIHNTLARTVSSEERDRVASNLALRGVVLEAHADLHAKFMIWDEESIVITSFNWLATTPDPWKPRGAEIGAVVKGPNLVSSVRDRFRELTGHSLEREKEVCQSALGIP
jgi:phosphatidylserine/phosphatidylglycerophosphate/cardiolipin synthase-like enzyme